MSVLLFLWIAFALNYVDRQMAFSMFPALRRDLGFTTAQLGLIGSLFLWVYTLSMPIAGRLADIWRRDWMILASLVLWSAATIGCGLSGSVPGFLVWRAVMGITEALYYPAAVALIAGVYSDAARSKALGLHQSAQLAGVVAGGWYGGWTADRIGWRDGFAYAGLAGIAYTFVLAFALRGARSSQASDRGRTRGSARQLLGSRCYIALAGAFLAFCAMLWIFYAWFPAFLYDRYRLSMTESGWNATLFIQASCGLGVVVGGFLADRMSRRWPAARFIVLAAGILLSAPFAYLTFAADSLALARLFSACFGAFAGLTIANVFAAAFDVVAAGNRGVGAGILNMTGGISSAAMIYLAGLWQHSVGLAALMLWVVAAAMLAACILIATVNARFEPERHAMARG